MDAWLVLVVVPQDIRSSQPVVINEAVLLSEGPYVGCFADLAGVGTVAHQDEAFLLSWYVVAPPNATPSCSLRSIVAVFGPGESVQANVTGSNLPVTIPTGQTRLVQVDFAPIDAPVWGSITVGVTETNP